MCSRAGWPPSAVTPDAPAKPGELVSLLGTGLGPYDRLPPDGFAIPAAAEFRLADRLQVAAGDTVVDPISALAATGQIGVTAVRLRIPDTASGVTPVKV